MQYHYNSDSHIMDRDRTSKHTKRHGRNKTGKKTKKKKRSKDNTPQVNAKIKIFL